MDGLATRDDAKEAVESIVEIWMEWINYALRRRWGQSLKVFARLFGIGMFWQVNALHRVCSVCPLPLMTSRWNARLNAENRNLDVLSFKLRLGESTKLGR